MIVSDDTRTVQIFLSKTGSFMGICEVSVHHETRKLSCTCPGFSGRSSCKHVTFVRARVDKNRGTYPLEIIDDVDDDTADAARESSDSFRDFVIKHGKIEVL